MSAGVEKSQQIILTCGPRSEGRQVKYVNQNASENFGSSVQLRRSLASQQVVRFDSRSLKNKTKSLSSA